jgi:secretion/DNA translocation related TadE-like protein
MVSPGATRSARACGARRIRPGVDCCRDGAGPDRGIRAGPGRNIRHPPIWFPAAGRDGGSATIWVLACSMVVLLVALVVAIRTAAAVARHRAETAADLAALAAAGRIGYVPDVAAICAAAEAIATANRGQLLACTALLQPDGQSGTVSVRAAFSAGLPIVGNVRASASARAGRLPASSTPEAAASSSAGPAPP